MKQFRSVQEYCRNGTSPPPTLRNCSCVQSEIQYCGPWVVEILLPARAWNQCHSSRLRRFWMFPQAPSPFYICQMTPWQFTPLKAQSQRGDTVRIMDYFQLIIANCRWVTKQD